MRVDEAGKQVLAGSLNRVDRAFGAERVGCPELGDLTVADQHVVGFVDAGARIEHVGAAYQQLGRAALGREQPRARLALGVGQAAHQATAASIGEPASSSYRTAIRTATPALTWSPISACGESIVSADSSIPRLTGPGCITS